VSKIETALRLAARADWTTLHRRWTINMARWRVNQHGGRAFVHHDLGFPFVCHPDWPGSLEAFLSRSGDFWEFDLLRAWLEPGDTFLDIGANIGQYAAAAAAIVGTRGTIVAVDADAFAVRKLEEAMKLLRHDRVIPVHAAVTDRTGIIEFFVHPDRVQTEIQSLRPAPHQRARTQRLVVPAHTLQSLARLHLGDAPSAVKVDIEGAEAQALASVPEGWLGPEGPLWIVEINPSALEPFETSPWDVAGRFADGAFEILLLPKHPYDPRSRPALRPLRSDEAFADSVFYNLVAIPRGPGWRERAMRVGSFVRA